MTRKLVFLNLVLIAMLGAAVYQIQERLAEARKRESALAAMRIPVAPTPQIPRVDPVAPVTAANYIDVAQKMIFSRDRNPNVIVEEKPPEPTPAFPIVFGYFDLGAGPTVFMIEKPGAQQKSYHIGNNVGPFKIAALNATDITLEWKDKKFEKKLSELKAKPSDQPAQQAAARPDAPKPEAIQAKSDEELGKIREKQADGLPGINVGASARMCAPGDSAPAGTVQGGFRKVVNATPFGQSCRWEPVGR